MYSSTRIHFTSFYTRNRTNLHVTKVVLAKSCFGIHTDHAYLLFVKRFRSYLKNFILYYSWLQTAKTGHVNKYDKIKHDRAPFKRSNTQRGGDSVTNSDWISDPPSKRVLNDLIKTSNFIQLKHKDCT